MIRVELRMMEKILLLVMFLLKMVVSFAISQNPEYKHFTTADGLPSSEVYNIYQDGRGHLWFATDRGLAEYDGSKFKTYGLEDGLPGISIIDLFPQTNGDVWGATAGGKLFYFNHDFKGVIAYKYNEKLQKKELGTIRSVYVNSDKSLFVAGSKMGASCDFVKIDSTGKQVVHGLASPLAGCYIASFLDKKGGCFIHLNFSDKRTVYDRDEEQGYYKSKSNINLNHYNFAILNDQKAFAFSDATMLEIYNSKNKLIYSRNIDFAESSIGLGTIQGESFFLGQLNEGVSFIDQTGKVIWSGLKGYSVTQVIKDHEENYWFSTLESGVFLLKKPMNELNTVVKDEKSSVKQIIRFKNEILVSYEDGKLQSYNQKGGKTQFSPYEKGRNFLVRPINMALRDDGCLYYNTGNKLRLENTTKQDSIFVQAHFSSNKFSESTDPLLITCKNNFLKVNGLKADELTDFALDIIPEDVACYKGKYYVASVDGLFAYDSPENGTIPLLPEEIGVRTDDIDLWHHNKLLLATLGKGILEYNLDKGICKRVAPSISAIVTEVTVENDSTIWACTNEGLFRIICNDENTNWKVQCLNVENGLTTNQVTSVLVEEETVWVGTRNGLHTVPKSFFDKKFNKVDYFFRLEKVIINDEELKDSIDLNDGLCLAHDQNRLELFYQAISFGADNKIIFDYSLQSEGSDDSTQFFETSDRHLSFASMKPGKYWFTMRLKVFDAKPNGAVIRFPITILNPWWSTWWFRICLTLLVGVLIYLFFKIKVFTYNRDISRELLRQVLKRVTPEERYIIIPEKGKKIKVESKLVRFIKSDGNYLEVHTEAKQYLIRCTLRQWFDLVPDKLEYLRINRSFIVRIDKITEKSAHAIFINGEEIPVGKTYKEEVQKIIL